MTIDRREIQKRDIELKKRSEVFTWLMWEIIAFLVVLAALWASGR